MSVKGLYMDFHHIKKMVRLVAGQKRLLLLFFPLFYLLTGFYFRLILEDPSLRSVDPDYVYFCTGLNMAEGHLKVAHIDHPGTPLQYLTAAVFRIVWWFRGEGAGFTDDVLSHPDLYLAMVNLVLSLLLAAGMLGAGRAVFRKTGSVTTAMVVQTIPLLPFILWEIIGRISPEQILALPIIALSVFLIGKSRSSKQEYTTADMLVLALITGFGLSIKLTLLPLMFFPLMVVPGWKKKAVTLLLSLLFFLVIALPATLQIERFWHWIRDLFLFSGQYGSGEKNVVDLAQMAGNIRQIVRLEPHFTILTGILAVVTLISLATSRRKKHPVSFSRNLMAMAVLLAITLHALMAGKQYAPRYIMPAMMYGPLIIFLLCETVRECLPSRIVEGALSLLLSVFLIWTASRQIPVIRYTSEAFLTQIEARKMTREAAAAFEPGSIRIIASADYGSPFPEYALHFFTAWAPNSLKPHYAERLGTLYPGTIHFNPLNSQLVYWGKAFDTTAESGDIRPVYLFLGKNQEELFAKTLGAVMENKDSIKVLKELLFENPVNGEALYRVHFFPENPSGTESASPETSSTSSSSTPRGE